MKRAILSTFSLLIIAAAARAEIKTETVTYKHDGQTLKGFFAWDTKIKGKRPGVLVIHEWWGLNDYARKRAKMLAKLGYVAFAADMYGEGKVTKHPKEAGKWAGMVRQNEKTWEGRTLAGLQILKDHPKVDGSRIAAIGYCFGGSTVLQLAYSGAEVDAVVSFHGALPKPSQKQAKAIKSTILICHGAKDAFIPEKVVSSVRKALEAAEVDYQIIYHGGARHSFTVPDANKRGIENIRYDEAADRRSWAAMQMLFDEVFTKKK